MENIILNTYTHTHTFNGPLSGTTRVRRYQKGKTNLDFTETRDSEWQWNPLGHMQVCTSLQTNNHASTPPLSFLQARCPSCRPTNSVKALKATTFEHILNTYRNLNNEHSNLYNVSIFHTAWEQHQCKHMQFLIFLLCQEHYEMFHKVGISQNSSILSCKTEKNTTRTFNNIMQHWDSLTNYWHCPHSMRGRKRYGDRVSICLSIYLSQHGPTAANQLLQVCSRQETLTDRCCSGVWWVNVSSAVTLAYMGSWTQTGIHKTQMWQKQKAWIWVLHIMYLHNNTTSTFSTQCVLSAKYSVQWLQHCV